MKTDRQEVLRSSDFGILPSAYPCWMLYYGSRVLRQQQHHNKCVCVGRGEGAGEGEEMGV